MKIKSGKKRDITLCDVIETKPIKLVCEKIIFKKEVAKFLFFRGNCNCFSVTLKIYIKIMKKRSNKIQQTNRIRI